MRTNRAKRGSRHHAGQLVSVCIRLSVGKGPPEFRPRPSSLETGSVPSGRPTSPPT